MCKIYNIPRSSLYYKRRKRVSDTILKTRIAVHRIFEPYYGYRRHSYYFEMNTKKIHRIIQTIFIDNINNSEFKNKRADFSFNEFDKQAYQYSLESIKKNNIFLNKFDAKDLPKRWIELFQYKGKFYTYYYCDFCGDYRLEFRKNMLLETTCIVTGKQIGRAHV